MERRAVRTSRGRRAMLSALAARLVQRLREARRDLRDQDRVHDARVAARRLQAAATILAPGVDLAAPLRRGLRALGRIRSRDVAIAYLRDGDGERRARSDLIGRLRRERREARRRARSALRPRRLARDLDLALACVPDEALPGPEAAFDLYRRVVDLLAKGDPSADPERTHTMRIAIKRLRYAHEAIEETRDPESFARVHRLLADLQGLLGEWHDRDVIRALILERLREAEAGGRLARSLLALEARLKEEMAALLRTFTERAAEMLFAQFPGLFLAPRTDHRARGA